MFRNSLRIASAAVIAVSLLQGACGQTPTTAGLWVKITNNTGVVPVHAAYSPGDKLFLNERIHYIGTTNDGFTQQEIDIRTATNWYSGNPNFGPTQNLTDAAEFDFVSNTYRLIDHYFPLLEDAGKNEGYAFCAGHTQMADGTYVVAGGDQFWRRLYHNVSQTSDGRRDIRIMTPSSDTKPPVFVKVGEIYNARNLGRDDDRSLWGRWYPSLVQLPDETILIIGGQRAFFVPDNSSWDNPTYEVFNPTTKLSSKPVRVNLLVANYPVNMYPVVYVLPKTGNVWVYANNASAVLNIATGTETPSVSLDLSKEDGLLGRSFPFAGTNFLPMLSYKNDYKMVSWFCGGVNGTNTDGNPMPRAGNSDKWYANCPDCYPTARCNYLELENDAATWQREEMPIARSQPTAVNLPDGTVIILNGSGRGHQGGVFGQPLARQAVAQGVILNPKAPVGSINRWKVVATAPTGRHYHNIALLREDGTVVTGGGDSQNGDDPNVLNPADMTLDVYSPPYKFASNIPELAPLDSNKVTYNQLIIVPFTTAIAANISRVTMIRYASVTHTINLDQRHIELEIVKYAADRLLVRLPASSMIATAGNWMLWPVDSRGVPVKKSALLNIRASNPGGDAAWDEATTIKTPVFANPYAVLGEVVPTVPDAQALKSSGEALSFGMGTAGAIAAGLAAVAAGLA
ncbi:hypothetical protein HDU86_002729 [Geranomyces michiganensis]|nr:hypothetical protein HDU86_002729 [Geranomyces michiganensis]